MKNTIVISAYPACGKSYFYEHNQDKYSVLDSDSSKFSWKMRKYTQEELNEIKNHWDSTPHLLSGDGYINQIKDSEIKVRDENFPNNYIEHIKENLGKVDIIFVSSHLSVRQAMTDAGIPFFTVYPQQELLNEWVGRMYRRGNDKEFIDFQIKNWDKFTDLNNIYYNEPHGIELCLLQSNTYITEELIESIRNNFGEEIRNLLDRIYEFDALMDYAEGKIG